MYTDSYNKYSIYTRLNSPVDGNRFQFEIFWHFCPLGDDPAADDPGAGICPVHPLRPDVQCMALGGHFEHFALCRWRSCRGRAKRWALPSTPPPTGSSSPPRSWWTGCAWPWAAAWPSHSFSTSEWIIDSVLCIRVMKFAPIGIRIPFTHKHYQL